MKEKELKRPNKDNFWLEEVKSDGVKSIPFDHYNYELALERYCDELENARPSVPSMDRDKVIDVLENHLSPIQIEDGIMMGILKSSIEHIADELSTQPQSEDSDRCSRCSSTENIKDGLCYGCTMLINEGSDKEGGENG